MDLIKARKRYLPMSETMFYILASFRQERHGYGIMLEVADRTGGRIKLGAGTVYQSLSKLEGDGLIQPTREVDRKKQYQMTALGKVILEEESRRILALGELARDVLGTQGKA